MSSRHLVLITRPGCHLCEEALVMLGPLARELGATLREAGTDSPEAAALTAGGRELPWVPVLVERGRVLAYGRISEPEARAALAPVRAGGHSDTGAPASESSM